MPIPNLQIEIEEGDVDIKFIEIEEETSIYNFQTEIEEGNVNIRVQFLPE